MGHESFDRSEIAQSSSDRAFGIVFAVVFLLIGVLPLVFGGAVRVWSVAVSAIFLAIALLRPVLLAPLNRLWTRFALLLHKIVSPVVLGIMFFVVITPMGWLQRAVGRDPLRLRFDREARSYWVDRVPPGPPPETLDNQF
jgi:Saxitoxin biosynthesis operon protein SxtJ